MHFYCYYRCLWLSHLQIIEFSNFFKLYLADIFCLGQGSYINLQLLATPCGKLAEMLLPPLPVLIRIKKIDKCHGRGLNVHIFIVDLLEEFWVLRFCKVSKYAFNGCKMVFTGFPQPVNRRLEFFLFLCHQVAKTVSVAEGWTLWDSWYSLRLS